MAYSISVMFYFAVCSVASLHCASLCFTVIANINIIMSEIMTWHMANVLLHRPLNLRRKYGDLEEV